jgi:UDP-glucose:(heptosyl)LPS alpha-1,3-glucosyltransferase
VRLAFCLFRYFPYGGLQRDFLHIVKLCLARGDSVTVYAMKWEGFENCEGSGSGNIDNILSKNLTVNIISLPSYCSNHTKAIKFSSIVNNIIKNKTDDHKYDLIMGFNKMSGLDLYYCADSCYVAKVDQQKSGLIKLFYKLTSRYKNFKFLESELFKNKTKILFLSTQEKINYQNYYNIKQDLIYLLPPNIDKNRFQPVIDPYIKNNLKIKLAQDLNLKPNNHWLLMIGSGFRTKGVDRSIRLVKNLLEKLNNNISNEISYYRTSII